MPAADFHYRYGSGYDWLRHHDCTVGYSVFIMMLFNCEQDNYGLLQLGFLSVMIALHSSRNLLRSGNVATKKAKMNSKLVLNSHCPEKVEPRS